MPYLQFLVIYSFDNYWLIFQFTLVCESALPCIWANFSKPNAYSGAKHTWESFFFQLLMLSYLAKSTSVSCVRYWGSKTFLIAVQHIISPIIPYSWVASASDARACIRSQQSGHYFQEQKLVWESAICSLSNCRSTLTSVQRARCMSNMCLLDKYLSSTQTTSMILESSLLLIRHFHLNVNSPYVEFGANWALILK